MKLNFDCELDGKGYILTCDVSGSYSPAGGEWTSSFFPTSIKWRGIDVMSAVNDEHNSELIAEAADREYQTFCESQLEKESEAKNERN